MSYLGEIRHVVCVEEASSKAPSGNRRNTKKSTKEYPNWSEGMTRRFSVDRIEVTLDDNSVYTYPTKMTLGSKDGYAYLNPHQSPPLVVSTDSFNNIKLTMGPDEKLELISSQEIWVYLMRRGIWRDEAFKVLPDSSGVHVEYYQNQNKANKGTIYYSVKFNYVTVILHIHVTELDY